MKLFVKAEIDVENVIDNLLDENDAGLDKIISMCFDDFYFVHGNISDDNVELLRDFLKFVDNE